MGRIFVDQVGYLTVSPKKAVLDFETAEFSVKDSAGNCVYTGKAAHFGKDDISGEDVSVADFSGLTEPGTYRVYAGDVCSASFSVGDDVFDGLMKDICKCFYYLRCGDALTVEYAGEYFHRPCHMTKARVYGEDSEPVAVLGGWHDAGDYGRYSTAGAVAVAHLLYGVRFFPGLKDVRYDIPKVNCDSGVLPDILAEAKVELDFLLKMQREDGAVWHKLSTLHHAAFVMPEEDLGELFLYPVSSMAVADVSAIFAVAYTVYKDLDKEYAEKLLKASLLSYGWLKDHPEPLLFKNPEGTGTGEYGEHEDISNRFWAAAALYEATGEAGYREDALLLKEKLEKLNAEGPGHGRFFDDCFTGLGWGDVAGLGSFSFFLKGDEDDFTKDLRDRFIKASDRLVDTASRNGFDLCMEPGDFIWGSNMEVLKKLMILTLTEKRFSHRPEYIKAIISGIDYILGCNSMDVSYVTGNGEKAFKNPHLRPTAMDGIEEPWPGLVSGGPNVGLQDHRAKELSRDLPPMKCYLDHVDCYSLNEITIYWNSPLVFVLAGIKDGLKR